MMSQISAIAVLLFVVCISACVDENTSKVYMSYSKANARGIAEAFIIRSEHYGFDGRSVACSEARQLDCDGCWQFRCTFKESDGTMFGGKIHNVEMSVKEGKVVSAVLNGNITMM